MTVKEKQETFLVAFEPVRQQLSGYCRALTRNYEEARDTASEAIAASYSNFENIKNRASFMAYLFKTAKRICIRRRWRSRIFDPYNEEAAEKIPANSTQTDLNYDVEMLYAAIRQLPAKQGEAIVLFEISGFSIDEITKIQGSSLSAVKSRLKRGREKLKEMLTDTVETETNRNNGTPKEAKDDEVSIVGTKEECHSELVSVSGTGGLFGS
ncbi:MAG: polymerase, sigma-24 subunit, subfamily [Ignavibacteria bacterium]|nr:polymerase, sigma-24 subunit, subfamily [Ignavibacteria bacterium]